MRNNNGGSLVSGTLTQAGDYRRLSAVFLLIALLTVPFADLDITVMDAGGVLEDIAWGMVTPTLAGLLSVSDLLKAVCMTVAFALLALVLAAGFGFFMALLMRFTAVRFFAATIRAVHELFWGLLLMQLFGLTPLTAILAIAIPYAGMFARVYKELLESVDTGAYDALAPGSDLLSRWSYVRISQAWPQLRSYTLYRFECALRSSAVLGFIGLPTLGFYLETAFNQGLYSEAAALLYVFVLLIATIPLWMRASLWPIYSLLALYWLAPFQLAPFQIQTLDQTLLQRFFTEDIIPLPLRHSEQFGASTGLALWQWFVPIWSAQLSPGLINTLMLSLLALPLTGLLALLWFPATSVLFVSLPWRGVGHIFMVVLRSVPEIMLAFVALMIFGLSWLPALLALSIHNGAIIAHLMSRYSSVLNLRIDAERGINRYFFEVLPRVYQQFLSYLLYRWEIILRESAILGILGIHTLGFYIDSSFAEFRFDRAMVLITFAALLNIAVDRLALVLRRRLHKKTESVLSCY